MTSNRPYLLRALCDWILDNAMTPHLMVDATQEGVDVPDQYIDNGKIVLNIHPDAVQDFNISSDHVIFNARFNGKPSHIVIPMNAVMAVYSRENGKGMIFPDETPDDDKTKKEKDNKKGKPGAPHLKIIK